MTSAASLRVECRLHEGRWIQSITASDTDDHASILELATRYRRAAVPGVVAIDSFHGGPDPVLTLTLPGDETWVSLPPSLAVLAAGAVRLAVVLEQMHERGVNHGAVTERAVRVDRRGEPVLADMAPVGGSSSTDVRELAEMVQRCLAAQDPLDKADRRRARNLAQACRRVLAVEQPTATDAVRHLSRAQHAPSRGRSTLVAGLVLGLGLLGLVWGRHPIADTGDPPPDEVVARSTTVVPTMSSPPMLVSSTTTLTPAAPSFPAGPPPTIVQGGHRWTVGHAGDVVAVADWACDQRPAVMVARPGTGEVFLWRDWPVGGSEAGERVGIIPALTGFADPPVRRCGVVTLTTASGLHEIIPEVR